MITPTVLRPAIGGEFTVDDFDIDTYHRTVTCPAGHTVTIGASGTASFARHCQRCPLRRRCTTARAGRMLKIHPRPRPVPRRPTPGDESRVLDRLYHHPTDG